MNTLNIGFGVLYAVDVQDKKIVILTHKDIHIIKIDEDDLFKKVVNYVSDHPYSMCNFYYGGGE